MDGKSAAKSKGAEANRSVREGERKGGTLRMEGGKNGRRKRKESAQQGTHHPHFKQGLGHPYRLNGLTSSS